MTSRKSSGTFSVQPYRNSEEETAEDSFGAILKPSMIQGRSWLQLVPDNLERRESLGCW